MRLVSASGQLAIPGDPVARALAILGGRWTFGLVVVLLGGPLRFGQIKAALPGISANILTIRLRTLESAGVIEKRSTGSNGGGGSYALTDWGMELRATYGAITNWGRQSGARRPEPTGPSESGRARD